MPKTTAEQKAKVAARQAAFRRRQEADGMVQVTGFVPGSVASEVQQLIRRLRADPALTVGPLRNVVTGKLDKLAK